MVTLSEEEKKEQESMDSKLAEFCTSGEETNFTKNPNFLNLLNSYLDGNRRAILSEKSIDVIVKRYPGKIDEIIEYGRICDQCRATNSEFAYKYFFAVEDMRTQDNFDSLIAKGKYEVAYDKVAKKFLKDFFAIKDEEKQKINANSFIAAMFAGDDVEDHEKALRLLSGKVLKKYSRDIWFRILANSNPDIAKKVSTVIMSNNISLPNKLLKDKEFVLNLFSVINEDDGSLLVTPNIISQLDEKLRNDKAFVDNLLGKIKTITSSNINILAEIGEYCDDCDAKIAKIINDGINNAYKTFTSDKATSEAKTKALAEIKEAYSRIISEESISPAFLENKEFVLNLFSLEIEGKMLADSKIISRISDELFDTEGKFVDSLLGKITVLTPSNIAILSELNKKSSMYGTKIASVINNQIKSAYAIYTSEEATTEAKEKALKEIKDAYSAIVKDEKISKYISAETSKALLDVGIIKDAEVISSEAKADIIKESIQKSSQKAKATASAYDGTADSSNASTFDQTIAPVIGLSKIGEAKALIETAEAFKAVVDEPYKAEDYYTSHYDISLTVDGKPITVKSEAQLESKEYTRIAIDQAGEGKDPTTRDVEGKIVSKAIYHVVVDGKPEDIAQENLEINGACWATTDNAGEVTYTEPGANKPRKKSTIKSIVQVYKATKTEGETKTVVYYESKPIEMNVSTVGDETIYFYGDPTTVHKIEVDGITYESSTLATCSTKQVEYNDDNPLSKAIKGIKKEVLLDGDAAKCVAKLITAAAIEIATKKQPEGSDVIDNDGLIAIFRASTYSQAQLLQSISASATTELTALNNGLTEANNRTKQQKEAKAKALADQRVRNAIIGALLRREAIPSVITDTVADESENDEEDRPIDPNVVVPVDKIGDAAIDTMLGTYEEKLSSYKAKQESAQGEE